MLRFPFRNKTINQIHDVIVKKKILGNDWLILQYVEIYEVSGHSYKQVELIIFELIKTASSSFHTAQLYFRFFNEFRSPPR